MFQPAPASQPAPVRPTPQRPLPPVSPHIPPMEAHASPPVAAPEALPPEALRALDALFGSGRVVAHRPCFGRLFGGAACGLLLSQFWFWAGTPTVQARTSGWFWKAQREITEETGLSRAETATARRRLCAQGVLEEKRCGIPATLHFRVDMAAVLRLVWAHLQAQARPPDASPAAAMPHSGVRGTRTLVCAIPASQFAGIAQTTSEIISERTQEITQTRARPILPSAFADRRPGRGPDRSGGRGAFQARGVFRDVRVAEAVVRGAVSRAVAGGAALSTGQQAVNRGGAARFKAALAAARRGAARPEAAAGRAPPDGVG